MVSSLLVNLFEEKSLKASASEFRIFRFANQYSMLKNDRDFRFSFIRTT